MVNLFSASHNRNAFIRFALLQKFSPSLIMLWSQPKILSGQVSLLSIHVCEYLTSISSYDWGGTTILVRLFLAALVSKKSFKIQVRQ